MTEKYDEETTQIMSYAIEDMQTFMANAGATTREAEILSWQQGYIAGVNRAMGIKNG
jgi:hypothetical protein